jgi:formylglycine-generating enzyme required for sulfatase activity
MSPSSWSRLAAGLCAVIAALALAAPGAPEASADVADEQVDLSLSDEGRAFTNGAGMTFVFVRRGTFTMGAPANEPNRDNDEKQHKVEITRDFYLASTETTQRQYEKVMARNPAHFSKTGGGAARVQGMDTSAFPVEQVSPQDVRAFIDKLNARDKRRSGWKYALPTEAQWEYACRGGPEASVKPIRFAKPQDSLSASEANFIGGSPYNGGKAGQDLRRPARVASYKPNNLGLYDMHGNVWEWTADFYAADYGGTGALRDPTGPARGTSYVLKGGAFHNTGGQCRSAKRLSYSSAEYAVGFRVAFVQVR